MNYIQLHGTIKNIQYSHTIGDTEFYKANLISQRQDGKEDIIELKFKKFSNPYKENDIIDITGNVRTYSYQVNDVNKVAVYVFTYLDEAQEMENSTNCVMLDGNICKTNGLRKTQAGKDVLDFILANNIQLENNKCLNCYIPLVAWGKNAKKLAKLPLGTKINIRGELRSREYKKILENGEAEIRIAHEVNISEIIDDLSEIQPIEEYINIDDSN